MSRSIRARLWCPLLHIEELEDRTVPTLLGQQLFPADNPWNQRISTAPVAASSAAILGNIINRFGDGRLHPDFGQDYRDGSDLYGIPYNVVHGNSTPKVSVVIDAYPGESDQIPAPIPAGAVLEGDFQNGPRFGLNNRGDSHLIVYDVDNNIAYEFYRASRPSENTDGRWHADQQTVWDMRTNTFRTLGWTSADAAGLPILASLVRPDEALPVAQGGQGVINHAIRFTLQNSIILDQFLYPASHTANPGNTNSAIQPPMGARFRLKAGVDLSQFNPQARIVAQAMKDYGMIVADNGSNFYFTGASYAVDGNNQFSLTWDDDDIQDSARGLKGLRFSDFEVVDLTPVVTGLSLGGGPAGTTVTVFGQNFSGAAGRLQVFFGSTPATSVNLLNDHQFVVMAPPGSGTVDVRVQSGITTAPDPDNLRSPIFGYGVSAVSIAARFTYGSSPIPPPVGSPPAGSPPTGSAPTGSVPTGSAPTGPGSVGTVPGGTGTVSFPATVGVVDQFSTWYLKNSNSPGFPDAGLFAYGARGWIPVVGDWDGDGVTTIGVFDPGSATWYLRNRNSPGAPDYTPFAYGAPGWIPVVGDWDGDGTTTIGVFDPATATWYLRNSNSPGAPDIAPFAYGAPTWTPVVGDWDGEGRSSVGVFDPGSATWYLRNDNSPGAPDAGLFAYGAPGWKPVVGDWDGDGRSTAAVFDLGGQWYLKNANVAGAPDVAPFAYGAPGWLPVAGTWSLPGQALHAEGVPQGDGGSGALSAEALRPILDAVLTRVHQGGIGIDPSALRAEPRFEIGRLEGSLLGLAFADEQRVLLDADAAGRGWFVDPTPLLDEEFLADGTAVAGGPGSGRIDLLTAVLHELGHLAGLEHEGGLLSATLGAGRRHVH